MSFFRDWLEKFIFLLKWKFVKLVEIKPFLQVDKKSYCPVCGDVGEKQINAVSDGQATNCRLGCKVCGWIWDVESVTEIKPGSVILGVEGPEGEEEAEDIARRQTPRFVTIPSRGEGGVKVNGEVLVDRFGDYKRQPKKVVSS